LLPPRPSLREAEPHYALSKADQRIVLTSAGFERAAFDSINNSFDRQNTVHAKRAFLFEGIEQSSP